MYDSQNTNDLHSQGRWWFLQLFQTPEIAFIPLNASRENNRAGAWGRG